MSWNYRVVRTKQARSTSYQIHEVYYDDLGAIKLWSEPIDASGETPEELKADLEMMLRAFQAPVLRAEDMPGSKRRKSMAASSQAAPAEERARSRKGKAT